MKKLLLFTLLTFCIVSCTTSQIDELSVSAPNPETQTVVVTVNSCDSVESKVSVNDDWSVSWVDGESLWGWSLDDGTSSEFTMTAYDANSSTFTGEVSGESYRLVSSYGSNYCYFYEGTSITVSSLGAEPIMISGDIHSVSDVNPTPTMQHVGAAIDLNVTFSNIPSGVDYTLEYVQLDNVCTEGVIDLTKKVDEDGFFTSGGSTSSVWADGGGLVSPTNTTSRFYVLPTEIPSGAITGEGLCVTVAFKAYGVSYTVFTFIPNTSFETVEFKRATHNTVNCTCDLSSLPATLAQALIAGLDNSFKQYLQAETSTTRHNDFGYAALMLFMDANGYDFVSSYNGYNWFGNSLTYGNRDYSSYDALIVWNTLYNQIDITNSCIEYMAPLSSSSNIFDLYLAQAYAIRAFDYLTLAQLYQFNYADHQSDPCVPIITEENSAVAAVNGCARNTVAEVYAQVITDLERSLDCLESSSTSRSDNGYVSKEVVYGLLARANLAMENWNEAGAYAQAAQAYGYPASFDAVSTPTFNDISQFMWGINVEESDSIVTSGICNWPSHMGSLNWGYCSYNGGMQVSKALFDQIPDSDARKGWWTNSEGLSANLTAEQQYIITSYVGYRPYTQVKFAPYNDVLQTSTNASDVPLMRVEEMYLIEAEAKAMQGNIAGALEILNTFVTGYRDPNYTCTATTSEEILEEILFQRRVELWGEGLAWFDIMRLETGVDRRGANYPDATSVFNIAADDDILLWRIPQSVIESNALISESDNNPEGSAPTAVEDFDNDYF